MDKTLQGLTDNTWKEDKPMTKQYFTIIMEKNDKRMHVVPEGGGGVVSPKNMAKLTDIRKYLYATKAGAKRVANEWSKSLPDWTFRIEPYSNESQQLVFKTRRYIEEPKPFVRVRAVIRYNAMDGKNVAYFKQKGRWFKILDAKNIRPLSPTMLGISSLSTHWSKETKVQFVYEDEQLLFNGQPLGIGMDVFNVKPEKYNVAQ